MNGNSNHDSDTATTPASHYRSSPAGSSPTPPTRSPEEGTAAEATPTTQTIVVRRVRKTAVTPLHEAILPVAGGGETTEASRTDAEVLHRGEGAATAQAATGNICKTCGINRTRNRLRAVCDVCTSAKFRKCSGCGKSMLKKSDPKTGREYESCAGCSGVTLASSSSNPLVKCSKCKAMKRIKVPYKECFECATRECTVCGKRSIKASTKYKVCFDCL